MSAGPGDSVVAVLGASGFVGSAVVAALQARGTTVRQVRAPRLRSAARSLVALRRELRRTDLAAVRESLAAELAGAAAVVNAAGLATAVRGWDDALVGGDALLPGVLAGAVGSDVRLVHVSSAAVQGRVPVLDESTRLQPFSPYSTAKSWGEELMRDQSDRATCVRPTSVHGAGRAVTRALVRVLRSPAASVAGAGDRPTPQVLVGNVADAVAHTALAPESPPPVVLQPWEGLTTAELVRVLGRREPRHVPEALARAAVGAAQRVGAVMPPAAGVARRVEMMWFGQAQQPGWLDSRWRAPLGRDAWKELG